MELGTIYMNGSAAFVAHAIEAEDYVGTLHDDRGARRHIVTRADASKWSAAKMNEPILVEETPAQSVSTHEPPHARGKKK